jgi:hypothetical protein
MGHDSTAMVIIDPFDSGERLGEAKDRQLLAVALFPAAKHSPEGAIHLVFTSWRQLHAVLSAGDVVYGEPKDLAVWVKAKQPQGLLHSSQHELIFVFENGDERTASVGAAAPTPGTTLAKTYRSPALREGSSAIPMSSLSRW